MTANGRPRGRNALSTTSSVDQRLNDLPNSRLKVAILDAARAITLRRPDVDHGIEFDPLITSPIGINIDAPNICLRRTIVEKQGLFVGVKLAANRHDLATYVDGCFHHIPEPVPCQFGDFGQYHASANDAWLIVIHWE